MEKAKVYFTDFRTQNTSSLLEKLHRLLEKAGMSALPLDGKFTAIKIHFGEPGNLAFLRPNFARVVVDALKKAGARPFLTDCNTLYPGMRRNALDHLDAAYLNGFSPLQTGCHVIIADGLLGTDFVSVPVQGEYCDHALIGRAAVDAQQYIRRNIQHTAKLCDLRGTRVRDPVFPIGDRIPFQPHHLRQLFLEHALFFAQHADAASQLAFAHMTSPPRQFITDFRFCKPIIPRIST